MAHNFPKGTSKDDNAYIASNQEGNLFARILLDNRPF